MTSSIYLYGIKTNNLKNLDIEILKNAITSITGVSGGGKSSLAYDTIYALCEQEFLSISEGYFEDAKYFLDSYKGIAPAVAIKQTNRNSNPRSTIYSYYNFSSILSSIPCNEETNIEYDDLRLNKPGNECEVCGGSGTLYSIDERKVIDPELSLSQNPFIPWKNKASDKYEKLLKEYCEFKSLDINKPFRLLSAKVKNDILYAQDFGEFVVKFKHNGRHRQRRMSFTGPMTELKNALTSDGAIDRKLAEKFSAEMECSSCGGSKISEKKYRYLKILGIPMIDLLSKTIDEIIEEIQKYRSNHAAVLKLKKNLECISQMGLGYLSLSRSIPSLSGGELQKLNFCRLMISEISGIIVVIDEISSQVHVSDYPMIINEIEKIKSLGNTVILVEHNSYFINRSDYVIEIGPGSGRFGGNLVKHKPHTQLPFTNNFEKSLPSIKLPPVWKNNIKGLTLEIFSGGINVICGKSGSGKSSIAEYFSETLDNVIYVSQSFIRGHVRSSVASYLDMNEIFSNSYAKHFGTECEIFSPSAGKLGSCKTCSGTGLIRKTIGYNTVSEVICETCNGKLFSLEVENYEIAGLSISNLYALPIEEILEKYDALPKKAVDTLEILCSLRLGHLSLNRKTSSLSGGELRRLKLLKHLSKRKSDKILIIDEPGAGLDDRTCEVLMDYLHSFAPYYKSIVVIDHKPSIFLRSDLVVEIERNPTSSDSKVIYQGNSMKYFEERYAPYLQEKARPLISKKA
jgi:excinuclease ABC subunit A